MTAIKYSPIPLPPVRDHVATTLSAQASPTMGNGHVSAPRALSPREVAMQLPIINADSAAPDGSSIDQFRLLADFQDVIDSAADAGLIDDEAAVVFHRQLIAWSRLSIDRGTTSDAPRMPDAVITAAEAQAIDIIEDARAAAATEVAQVRSLTLTECDEILAAARAAAARIIDDAMVTAMS